MSKFHSTVTRRDFMKSLGFAGAGVAALGSATPVFRDLDELAASSGGTVSHPWYVKEREINNPTTPIDWDVLDYNFRMNSLGVFFGFKAPPDYPFHPMQYYNTAPDAGRNAQNVNNNIPGLRHKEYAFAFGSKIMERPSPWDSFAGPILGSQAAGMDPVPEWMGIPKWSGTPEEAAKMIRAAFRAYGAHKVGFLEICDKSNCFMTPGSVRFEDCDEPYLEGSGRSAKKIVPSRAKRAIVIQVPQPLELNRLQGDPKDMSHEGQLLHYGPMTAGSHMGYCNANLILARCQEFLRVLGYIYPGGMCYYNTGAGAFSGLNEIGRQGLGISPEVGATYRKNIEIITDLELPISPPIDAGIYNFCHDCGVCADACPWDSISKDREPTWELPPSEEGRPDLDIPSGTQNSWTRAGLKRWPLDYLRCHGCPYCQNDCVFTQKNFASIHQFIKGVVANTGIFNGFFANMDKMFGYGHKDNFDEWWERDLDNYRYDFTYDNMLH